MPDCLVPLPRPNVKVYPAPSDRVEGLTQTQQANRKKYTQRGVLRRERGCVPEVQKQQQISILARTPGPTKRGRPRGKKSGTRSLCHRTKGINFRAEAQTHEAEALLKQLRRRHAKLIGRARQGLDTRWAEALYESDRLELSSLGYAGQRCLRELAHVERLHRQSLTGS